MAKQPRGNANAAEEDDDKGLKEGQDYRLPDDEGKDLEDDQVLVGDADESHALAADDEPDEDDWDDTNGKDKNAGKRAKADKDVDVEIDDDTGEDEGDEEDARLAYDLDSEGRESEREGPSRRQRRNRSRRVMADRSQQEIAELRQRLEQMQGLVQQGITGQAQLAASTIDGRIQSATAAVEEADRLLAVAIENNDGKAFAAIQKQRDEAVTTLYGLRSARQRLETTLQQQRAPGQPTQQASQGQPRVNPDLAARAEQLGNRFLDRNQWFDPQGTDRDSRMARTIDEEVATDGYQPHTPAYWIEFEKRCREAGLGVQKAPPRRQQQADNDDGEEEERPARQEQRPARREPNLPPTGAVRTARGPGKPVFSLSRYQVQILEEEGLMEPNLSASEMARKGRLITKWRQGEAALRKARNAR